jgi:hypothetical protein
MKSRLRSELGLHLADSNSSVPLPPPEALLCSRPEREAARPAENRGLVAPPSSTTSRSRLPSGSAA